MKIRKLILTSIMIFSSLIFLTNIGTSENEYFPTDYEELYGIWINKNYGLESIPYPQKIINNPDGTFESYASVVDVGHLTGTYIIKDKWTDEDGNIWYKIIWKDEKQTGYELDKISNSGAVWEYLYDYNDYPTELDPNHPHYHIYYRWK